MSENPIIADNQPISNVPLREVPPVPIQFRQLFGTEEQYLDFLEERHKLFFS